MMNESVCIQADLMTAKSLRGGNGCTLDEWDTARNDSFFPNNRSVTEFVSVVHRRIR